jgi:hypothetical protein
MTRQTDRHQWAQIQDETHISSKGCHLRANVGGAVSSSRRAGSNTDGAKSDKRTFSLAFEIK